jgi:hypothetical protein
MEQIGKARGTATFGKKSLKDYYIEKCIDLFILEKDKSDIVEDAEFITKITPYLNAVGQLLIPDNILQTESQKYEQSISDFFDKNDTILETNKFKNNAVNDIRLKTIYNIIQKNVNDLSENARLVLLRTYVQDETSTSVTNSINKLTQIFNVISATTPADTATAIGGGAAPAATAVPGADPPAPAPAAAVPGVDPTIGAGGSSPTVPTAVPAGPGPTTTAPAARDTAVPPPPPPRHPSKGSRKTRRNKSKQSKTHKR